MTRDIYINPGFAHVWSGGEVDAKLGEPLQGCDLRIVCRDYSSDGFMAVCQVAEIARRSGAGRVTLTYPYLPYARQDRVTHREGSFSLQVFARLLNSIGLDSVTVYDAHSDVGPALIDRCVPIQQWEIAFPLVSEYLSDKETMFIAPDSGAAKKLLALVKREDRMAVCVKRRASDGSIANIEVFAPEPIKGRRCLIVDDICDGGRTFIELGRQLKTLGAGSVDLYVTHGIFSHGFDEIGRIIGTIHTTNSFVHERLPSFVKYHNIFIPQE